MKPTTRFNVPPIREMGSYSSTCSSRKDALLDYNHARNHDGLPPIRRMPAGTTYLPLFLKGRHAVVAQAKALLDTAAPAPTIDGRITVSAYALEMLKATIQNP